MSDSTLKIAKAIFIICLVLFFFVNNSLYIIVKTREIFFNNLFLFLVIGILILLWRLRNKNGF